jgi:beta-lactamase class D
MLNRRHAIGLFAAATVFPSHAFAKPLLSRQETRGGFLKYFADEGTTGTFVALKPDDKLSILSDSVRARQVFLPASTFKIPNSVIALETGVVKDPDKDVFKWDGLTRDIPEWNKDHTLRSAIAVSAVPVYQQIARKVGPTRMQSYVDAFDYGNHNIAGGIDRFWLSGSLRISAIQQIAFLDKLRRRVLPVSKRAQNLTVDILPVTKAGWLVGWAEKGSAQTVFALNLDVREPKHSAARMKIAQLCLAEIGAI